MSITRDDATLLAIVTQTVRDLGEITALRRCGTTLQRDNVLILLLLIIFLPLMSIGGWTYKGINFLIELFFDGLDGCFSGCLNVVVWVFLIALLLMMI